MPDECFFFIFCFLASYFSVSDSHSQRRMEKRKEHFFPLSIWTREFFFHKRCLLLHSFPCDVENFIPSSPAIVCLSHILLKFCRLIDSVLAHPHLHPPSLHTRHPLLSSFSSPLPLFSFSKCKSRISLLMSSVLFLPSDSFFGLRECSFHSLSLSSTFTLLFQIKRVNGCSYGAASLSSILNPSASLHFLFLWTFSFSRPILPFFLFPCDPPSASY